jgi:hypothetical protein
MKSKMVSKSESGHSKDEERKEVKVDDPFSGSRLPDRERPVVRAGRFSLLLDSLSESVGSQYLSIVCLSLPLPFDLLWSIICLQ